MIIKGLQPLSLLDYPGKPSAIVFLFGCNLRCGYCQNPGLVLAERSKDRTITEDEVFSFLDKRKGLLEGVVITGGEPCVNKGLGEFIKKIRSKGFLVKLDSNGCYPEVLKQLLDEKLVDYIAMDVKAPLSKYSAVAGTQVMADKIVESIRLIKESGVDYEFRTTVIPGALGEPELMEIGKTIDHAKAYYLQQFENKINLDPSFSRLQPYPKEFLFEMKEKLSPFAEKVGVRGVL